MHAHDWHAGLRCAYLAQHPAPGCRSVFTIHNLAFQGLFRRTSALGALLLDERTFVFDGLEFHGQGSFMKAGLKFAGRITTVSPTYAREIADARVRLRARIGAVRSGAARCSGILNGVDYAVWNPATDPLLEQRFDPAASPQALRAGKARAKQALQREVGLDVAPDRLLVGVVSRLTAQKGIDLVLHALPQR